MRNSIDPRTSRFALAAVLAVGCMPIGVHAQSLQTSAPADATPDRSANKSSDQIGLEDIVVTARKRSENLQSVPVAISALSAADLKQRNFSNVSELGQFAPGLTFDVGAGTAGGTQSANIFIRGIGQTEFQSTAEPGVGIYVDGVYFGKVVGSVLGLVDPERVEILRGPQGTLFGKNTIGGAISIVSQAPTADFSGYGELESGERSTLNAKASVNFALSEKLLVRASYQHQHHEGYDRSLIDGSRLGSLDSNAGRIFVRWQPQSNFHFDLIGDVTRARGSGQGVHPFYYDPTNDVVGFYNGASPFVTGTPPYVLDNHLVTGDRTSYQNGPLTGRNVNNVDQSGVSGTAVWDVSPNLSLTSITAYRKLKTVVGVDQDGSPLPYNELYYTVHSDQFSQELRAGGRLFDERLDYLVGGYYLHEILDDVNLVNILGGLSSFGADVTPKQHHHLHNSTLAFFTQETFRFTDQLSITAGIRYNHETKRDNAQSITRDTGKVLLPPGSVLSGTWNSVTPRVSIEYKPTEQILAYTSYAKGFKSGGFQYSIQQPSDFQRFEPEKVDTYEVGLKTTMFDKRVRANVAAFLSQYKNQQYTATVAPGQFNCPSSVIGTCITTINAARSQIKGIEFEGNALIAKGLKLNTSVTYLHNRFTKIDPLLIAGNVVTYATRAPKTPSWIVDAGLEYSTDLGPNELTARVDYSWRSTTFTDLTNDPRLRQSAYGLLNARIALRVARDWEFAVSGKNLTNKLYLTSGVGNPGLGYAAGSYGAPRTITGSIRYSF